MDLDDIMFRSATALNSERAKLAVLDDAAFRERFSGSPIKRIGRDRFVRNVVYAIGNSGDRTLLSVLDNLTSDPDETVAEAAHWARERLLEEGADAEASDPPIGYPR